MKARITLLTLSGLQLGGYAGYFQDPDGHLWEVAWNPQLRVED